MGLRSVANASKSPLPSFKEEDVLILVLVTEYDDGANADAVVARVERRRIAVLVFMVVFIFLIVWRSMCDVLWIDCIRIILWHVLFEEY